MDRGKMVPDREAPPQKAEAPKPDYEGNPEVEAFYRRAARKKIIERAAWYAKIMGVTYGRISIRAAKHAGAAAAGKET